MTTPAEPNPFADMTASELNRYAAMANAVSIDPDGFRRTMAQFQPLIDAGMFERYLREFDEAYLLAPVSDEEYATDAAAMTAKAEVERELLKLDPLAQVKARGCDYPDPPTYAYEGGVYRCRCMICGRCGHHTGNNTQGHYWALCKVTRTVREHHFCCPEACELEAKTEAVSP